MTHGSLFSGIGGFDLAARWAGIDTIWMVEKDAYCQKILSKNFPGVPIYDYVQRVDKNILAKPDIISGGFPCQDVSIINLFAQKLHGKRSGLWSEYYRLINELQPRYIIIENVAALVNRGLENIVKQISEIGYNTEWKTITASQVGAFHKRERVWVIAYPNSFGFLKVFEKFQNIFIEKASGKKREEWILFYNVSARNYKIEHWEKLANIICRNDDGIPGELDANRLRGLGNAIVPQTAYVIFEAIKMIDKNL